MRKSIALLAACAASASAFAPTGYVGLTRQAQTGVTSLSMNAGTGKIKVVSAARAGVPRATLSEAEKRKLANYDAAAALGVKQSPITYGKPPSSIGTGMTKAAPAKRVGLGTQPVTKPRAVAKPMSTQRVVAKPAPRAVAKPAPRVVAKPAVRAAPKPAPRVVAKPAPRVVAKPAPRVVAKPAPRAVPKPAPRVAPRAAPTPRAAPAARSFSMPSAPSFSMPSLPKPAAKAPVSSVAPPARSSSGGLDLLERVETLKVLTALYNAGALQKVERAKLLSTLEQAGALSQLEKLLPLIEEYKPITLTKTILSIPAGTFYAGAAAVSAGELGLILALPNDSAFIALKAITGLAAIPVAVGLVIGGQVNGVIQGTAPVNLQSFLGPRLRD